MRPEIPLPFEGRSVYSSSPHGPQSQTELFLSSKETAPSSPATHAAEIDPLLSLLAGPVRGTGTPFIIVGKLLALTDGGTAGLIVFPGQPGPAAIRAQTTMDLFPAHVGLDVLLTFDNKDRRRPIIIGVLRGQRTLESAAAPDAQVEADGQRVSVSARDELVLHCGRSSIKLTSNGHVEIRGEVIVSEASEVNHVRGGSVQLN
jgi:hypothetical protein